MSKSQGDSRRPATFGVVFGVAVAIYVAVHVPALLFPSKHGHGILSGWFGLMLVVFSACLLCSIWVSLVFGVYHLGKWKRFRTAFCLVPVVGLIALFAFEMYMPPNPHRLFKGYAKTELPENVSNLQWYFHRGGFDRTLVLYFETSPAQVDRLIGEMDLKLRRLQMDPMALSGPGFEGVPDFQEWKGVVSYERNTGPWWYTLRTNEAKTRVYIDIGDT